MDSVALAVDEGDVRIISSSVLNLVRNATTRKRDASWDDYVDQPSHDHWGDDR